MLAATQYSASERFVFLLLGALLIWLAIRGMSTGEIGLKFSTFRRPDGAPLFWFGIVTNFLFGIGCLLGFVFGMDIWGCLR